LPLLLDSWDRNKNASQYPATFYTFSNFFVPLTIFNFIIVFFRQRSEVTQNGVAYNWDNTGYGENTIQTVSMNWTVRKRNFGVSRKLYKKVNLAYFIYVHIEWRSRKERRVIAWLLAGVWQLKRVRRNTSKERGPFCLDEENIIQRS
jgi:hypothetical protein